MSHSIGCVGTNASSKETARWHGALDEAKWGSPSPQQVVARNWDWNISDDAWRSALDRQGEGPAEDVMFELWAFDRPPHRLWTPTTPPTGRPSTRRRNRHASWLCSPAPP